MKDQEKKKPEWVPDGVDDKYASYVVDGINSKQDKQEKNLMKAAHPTPRRRQMSVDDYVQGVLSGNRTILAQTITLVESNSPAHMETAQEVLKQLLPHTGKSIRIGITGVPGAGKSTLIEALGMMLCDLGHRVAVLAVDPSSTLTRGSILGDKTRMEKLSRNPNAFIRPSASGGTLGGVNRKSRETILVCEAFGFDVILVETVGVGQSEVTVRSMVDCFLLVMLTGGGDELQGIKKGVMELADAILVNKADGENKLKAQAAKAEFNRILHYLQPITEGWISQAYTCSALTGEGIADIWNMVKEFRDNTTASGVFAKRRQTQTVDWIYAMVEETLRASFYNHPEVKQMMPMIENAVVQGEISATIAAKQLLQSFKGESEKHDG